MRKISRKRERKTHQFHLIKFQTIRIDQLLLKLIYIDIGPLVCVCVFVRAYMCNPTSSRSAEIVLRLHIPFEKIYAQFFILLVNIFATYNQNTHINGV